MKYTYLLNFIAQKCKKKENGLNPIFQKRELNFVQKQD